jgi:hypothetical protein
MRGIAGVWLVRLDAFEVPVDGREQIRLHPGVDVLDAAATADLMIGLARTRSFKRRLLPRHVNGAGRGHHE